MEVGLFSGNMAMQTIRDRVAFHVRQHGFDRCMREIRAAQRTSGNALAELFASWGDPLNTGDEAFLRSCIAEINAANGPILLCGASLNAIVFGALCDLGDNKERQIWCLEDNRHWANVVRSWLTEYQISRAHVIHATSKLFADYVWYAVDPGRLARFQLIISDGARATPRGAIGALNRLGSRLDARCVLLARNVREADDLKALNVWAKTNRARFVLVDKQEGFVKLTREERQEELPIPEIQTGRQALKDSRVKARHGV